MRTQVVDDLQIGEEILLEVIVICHVETCGETVDILS
jgi:hypothetical protein